MATLKKTEPSRRRFGVALWVGILGGIVSAFVKWGAEVPLPPRTFSGGRDEFNPPYLFLQNYLHIDPTATLYEFSEHVFNPVMFTHILFSIVFAVAYCLLAEVYPIVKIGQGIVAGLVVTFVVHGILLPLLHLTPPLSELPIHEYISEIVGHIVWFWSIEVIRRDIRNRITKEPDAEIPLGSAR